MKSATTPSQVAGFRFLALAIIHAHFSGLTALEGGICVFGENIKNEVHTELLYAQFTGRCQPPTVPPGRIKVFNPVEARKLR